MKNINFNTNTDNNHEWLTPPDIIKSLGKFDLDPCSPKPDSRPWDTATTHYHEYGLETDWVGRVWCNPPYGRETFRWLDKLSRHEGGGIALIFARTETIGFHSTIWNKADSIFFFKGRLKFYYNTGIQGGTANAPSCLISYTVDDTKSIETAIHNNQLNGKIVKIN